MLSALEACCTLWVRGPAAILRRRSLLEARDRARCSAAEPRVLEGEEAALVALEMGEGGDAWLPFFSDPLEKEQERAGKAESGQSGR